MRTHRRRTLRRGVQAALVSILAVVTIAASGGVAYADNVQNDVTAGGNDTFVAGGSTTINYKITANSGDGQSGCNAEDTTPATVTIITPAGLTASPSSLTFTSCGTDQPVVFSSSTPGDYEITAGVSDSGTGTYNTQPAKKTLHVTAPTNTAPTVTVGGVSNGGIYEYGAVPAAVCNVTDTEDGPSSFAATVSPPGGALGSHTASCSYTDAGGLNDTDSATYTIVDTTPPTVNVPADITVEATSGAGAVVTFTVTATDSHDGSLTPTCSPASGSQFSLGTTTVNCSATDASGNTGNGSFTVTVEDTTAPVVSVPADITAEATGPGGAAVTYSGQSASDIVDGPLTPTCLPPSGSTFPLGPNTVNCSATDAAGNTGSNSFTVTVVDTTPPVITVPADITAEATGPLGAAVSYVATATDLVDGSITPICSPASGSTFAITVTTVSCTATDAAGNQSQAGFNVTVQDTTAPVVTPPGNVTATATSASGAVVTYSGASAVDIVDGNITPTCLPSSGSTFAIGTTTVTCYATDAAGNTGSATFTVTVSYDFNGFFRPIDNNGVVNVAKAGSAIPVKFSLGGDMGLSIFATGSPSSRKIACDSHAPLDTLEETVTAGNSSLSYDALADQYNYVWKTDKAWAGTCRELSVTLKDGSVHTALFKLTK